MGFRCRWLATRGRTRDDVLARLRLKVVAELVEEVYDTGLYALEVEDWLVVIGDGADHLDKVKRAEAARLSDGGDVVYLATDDTAMAFELVVFRGGGELWTVSYDGSDGVTAPAFTGAVPWGVRTLLARLEKAQAQAGGPKAEVDHIYELAPAYAMEVVGFRHDASLGSGDHVPIWQLAVKDQPRQLIDVSARHRRPAAPPRDAASTHRLHASRAAGQAVRARTACRRHRVASAMQQQGLDDN